ncbi:hotdog fold thioesterase [Epidermidibacterium keratini]|uniref:Hotdog fold thioesterase n=1 Tax=Epidermidibacterium keratini TaxID=1891644 RepID=A0A7L4YNC1_9ACTN|nr:PaaI family thioesterase [Epidermidibacterium keratini]QHC00309.1 hotdog fold thioesterase [Epidermidibacterium keratini]
MPTIDGDPTEFARKMMPLCDTLGMRVAQAEPQQVVLELDWAPELCTSFGVLHGGTLMALADAAGGLFAYLNLPEGAQGTTTIESKTNFLGAAKEGTVTATSTPMHVGGTTIVVETLVSAGDKPVTKTTQTQLVLRGR